MKEGYFNFKDYKLFYKYYTTEKNNAILVLVHGLGEHIGRYKVWAEKFNQYNYAICGFDLPGHGQSWGKRGGYFSTKDALGMIDTFIDRVKKDFPDREIILYGHSMGGNIAAQYLTQYNPKIKASILSSPWLDLAIKPRTLEVKIAGIVKRFFPNIIQKTGLKTSYISRDPIEVGRYENDHQVHDKISVGLFTEMYRNGKKIKKKGNRISIPTLAIHGTGDMLTSAKATAIFSEKNPLISFIPYEGGYHELHHDIHSEDVLNDILDWLTVNAKYT